MCSNKYIELELVGLSVLERKISTRQTREELIKKGVLIPDQGLSYVSVKSMLKNILNVTPLLPQNMTFTYYRAKQFTL